ncbi:MAG: HAD-superfamily hydrolase, subfamily variant 3 [Myxococcales bacterium]|nr:HAD-superfamily hydrolase, subfamily variant 3 [Myxococcales bacterium]
MIAPDAILFDLDGTLVDSERENVESVVLAARRWGAELTDVERAFVIGHSWNEIHALVVGNHALDVPMSQLIAAAVDEKRALLSADGYRALAGAVATVRRLARRSKLVVVSGASHGEVDDALASLGVADAFAFVMGAEDYPRGKPAPDPYAMAMERLGAVPARSIAIEDATPGILSARAAGARVVGVRAGNFSGYDLSAADVVVETLDDVTDELCARLVA